MAGGKIVGAAVQGSSPLAAVPQSEAASPTIASSHSSVSSAPSDARVTPATFPHPPAQNTSLAAAAAAAGDAAPGAADAAPSADVAAGAGDGVRVRKSAEADTTGAGAGGREGVAIAGGAGGSEAEQARAEQARAGSGQTATGADETRDRGSVPGSAGSKEAGDGEKLEERSSEGIGGPGNAQQGERAEKGGNAHQGGGSEQAPSKDGAPGAAAMAPSATNSSSDRPANDTHINAADGSGTSSSTNEDKDKERRKGDKDDDSDDDPNCHHVRTLLTPAEQCAYVSTHPPCQLGSWVHYLSLYYCRSLSLTRGIAATSMAVWLGALFFMLGNTAADFFCPSLEQLSHLLRLPPTVAGVTLLPLGNGAPDVFASIAAFVGTGQGQVGLNSVLGAATFVSCVVAGAVCIVAAVAAAARARAAGSAGAKRLVDATVVDGPSFIRDVCFFIAALLVSRFLLLSVFLYSLHKRSASHPDFLPPHNPTSPSTHSPAALSSALPEPSHLQQPLLPVDQWETGGGMRRAAGATAGDGSKRGRPGGDEEEEMEGGDGQGGEGGEGREGGEGAGHAHALPQWMWTRDVRIFQLEPQHGAGHGVAGRAAFMEMEEGADGDAAGGVRPLWGWGSDDEEEEEEEDEEEDVLHSWEPPSTPLLSAQGIAYWFFCLPAMLPRLLTIPLLPRDSRSRVLSLLSLALSPLFFLLVLQGSFPSPLPLSLAAASGALLSLLGLLASSGPSGAKHLSAAVLGPASHHHHTHHHRSASLRIPPRLLGLLWVVPGFVMSVVWFYVVANELVALLVSGAIVLRVSSSILGLTLLAWGNSIGDFVANLALAYGGRAIGGSGGGIRGRSERAAERVQIAWSGCYAGPMFNTLVGIGMSLVLTSWHSYPHAFVIPEDPTLPYTFVFLLFGLLLSLLVLPLSGFRLTRPLGGSLIFVYLSFLTLRLLDVVGVVTLKPWW
ncbi:unnamed protein product [Closterium sp. Naga37s-1]|nr:unnamed protein product [Closterium sp. Naga37s-1]